MLVLKVVDLYGRELNSCLDRLVCGHGHLCQVPSCFCLRCGFLCFAPAVLLDHCLCSEHIQGKVENGIKLGSSKDTLGWETYFAEDKHAAIFCQRVMELEDGCDARRGQHLDIGKVDDYIAVTSGLHNFVYRIKLLL